jgi:epoxyqueuosine reductase QueG
MLTAVLSSVPVEAGRRMEQALCKGPECGRCLSACPGDVIQHWDRDWAACDKYRSPHGFAKLAQFFGKMLDQPDPAKQKAMLRSEDSFYLWESILRGAGVVTGCRRCQDVCPIGDDYAMLKDALDTIPEDNDAKHQRLAAMATAEAGGEMPPAYAEQARWIGKLPAKV